MSGVADMLKGRDAIQKDLDRLKRWACINLMKFSKAQYKVLHLDQGNPMHKYLLGGERMENDPEEKDLGVLVDKKLNMTSHMCLEARKPIASWATSKEAWPAGDGGDFPSLLCYCEIPARVLCPAVGLPRLEGHGLVLTSPEENYKDDESAVAPLL
ncbi:rna-directed dna polymerase from mobile element jockey-like [Willisornis vidua]|uniref:Rna-directed dna polymerase from mobile element jockey-like n=1 Tax=Willisornis vidua TaxID=1566151 RepID=A0ABQ9DHT9_9PASS|nr:rna-directed dna polymerase from mobile element jockey-like [Willisornis vidua]